MMDANKKICLDEVSMRLLCSLKSERLRRGLTQKELGVKIGVARGIISHYECGRKRPYLCHLIKLSETFGYDLSSSVNYKYWHGQIKWYKLRQQMAYYGFTCSELSGYISYHINAVCTALYGEEDFSSLSTKLCIADRKRIVNAKVNYVYTQETLYGLSPQSVDNVFPTPLF